MNDTPERRKMYLASLSKAALVHECLQAEAQLQEAQKRLEAMITTAKTHARKNGVLLAKTEDAETDAANARTARDEARISLAEAEQRVEKLREEIKRAIERLEKFGRKGPKQVGRALIGLEAALAPEPTEPPSPRKECPWCNGKGEVRAPIGKPSGPVVCPDCRGRGYVVAATDEAADDGEVADEVAEEPKP